MPNTVVKLINAESTWLEATWEDRKLLIKKERDTQKCVSFFVVSAWEGRTAERGIAAWDGGDDYGSWLLYMRVPGLDACTHLLEKERQDIPSTPGCALKDRGAVCNIEERDFFYIKEKKKHFI